MKIPDNLIDFMAHNPFQQHVKKDGLFYRVDGVNVKPICSDQQPSLEYVEVVLSPVCVGNISISYSLQELSQTAEFFRSSPIEHTRTEKLKDVVKITDIVNYLLQDEDYPIPDRYVDSVKFYFDNKKNEIFDLIHYVMFQKENPDYILTSEMKKQGEIALNFIFFLINRKVSKPLARVFRMRNLSTCIQRQPEFLQEYYNVFLTKEEVTPLDILEIVYAAMYSEIKKG